MTPCISLDSLISALASLVPACGSASSETVGSTAVQASSPDDDIEMPEWLQSSLSEPRRAGEDSSSRFHRVVLGLYLCGKPAEEIVSMLQNLSWVPSRYAGRLKEEVERSLGKSADDDFPTGEPCAPKSSHTTADLELSVCAPLSDAHTGLLDRHFRLESDDVRAKVIDTLRFIEHVVAAGPGVAATPPGSGKSTGAVISMAVRAKAGQRQIMVVQDRRTARENAAKLGEMIGCESVGLYVGFNQDECLGLSGTRRTYRDCLRNSRSSECRTCLCRESCDYWRSGKQLCRAVLLMTTAGFMCLLEAGFDFSDRRVWVDEELAVFSDETFSVDELRLLMELMSNAGDEDVRTLVSRIFPALEISADPFMHKAAQRGGKLVKFSRLDGLLAHGVRSRLMRFIHSCGRNLRLAGSDDLFFRFVGFFRTDPRCDAQYAYFESDGRVYVKKSRISLSRLATLCSGLTVLDASAAISICTINAEIPIYSCGELGKRRNPGRVSAYVVAGNPTKSRRGRNSSEAFRMLVSAGKDLVEAAGCIMLPYNARDEGCAGDLELAIQEHCAKLDVPCSIYRISRGRLRGSNEARHCNLAFFTQIGLFTSLFDCALHACLAAQGDIPWSEMANPDGSPRMSRGRFLHPGFQQVYRFKTAALLYQAIYRTCVRNGLPSTVFFAVPDIEWLIDLWALMPFDVLKASCGGNTRREQFITGFSLLVNARPGHEISKRDAAIALGYCGRDPWGEHAGRLKELLGGFYSIGARTMERIRN